MTSSEIRRQFLDFFKGKQHTLVPSSPVVPHDDPTLLFTNAGMNPFKPIFLGQRAPDVNKWHGVVPGMATRAANTQKCIRAGGKHNDLDDVGKDTYHHTFFEMLGNWSFGDYFKREAIQWAWELLTKVWGIPKERLYATYFQGDAAEGLEPDREAADLWRTATDIGDSHVLPGNKKDNFWEMGDTGPCGPCSEIHIDLTPDCNGGTLVNAGDARVMEIWNLVFIQFNRGSDGKLTPLPAKHVDTGMGFERLCSVLQGLAAGKLGNFTNYDTDVFTPIFDAIRRRTDAPAYAGTLPGEPRSSDRADSQSPVYSSALEPPRGLKSAARDQVMVDVSYRVIADHVRALTFAITDGALPSNEGRGFVLRRILRRAVRFGRQYLNMHEPFICDLVEPLVAHMGDAFPELRTAHGGKNVKHVTDIIRDEEASFFRTLDRGMKLFEEAVERALPSRAHQPSGAHQSYRARQQAGSDPASDPSPDANPLPHGRGTERGVISGEDAFKLHDTYGFPIDLTQQMAEERGLTVDIAEYERLMEEARRVARSGTQVAEDDDEILASLRFDHLPDSVRLAIVETEDSTKYRMPPKCIAVTKYVVGDLTNPQGEVVIVTDRSCFYAEQGGQVADAGFIRSASGSARIVFSKRVDQGILVHRGRLLEGTLRAEEDCELEVDLTKRIPIQQNHTATHLLNWALREALCPPEERVNPHVQQKGSLVDAEKTRFDFSHNKALSEEVIEHIEGFVRMQIAADHVVYAASREEDFVDQSAARKVSTLRAVFGEKYPERVRVVSIGAPITEADAKAAGKSDWLLRNPQDPEWMRYSVEFCGGTHVRRTGEIEDFVIVGEEAVAKGVRRVVGVTAQAAREARARAAALRDRIAALWDAPEAEFHARLVEAQKEFSEAVIPVLDRHKIREQIDQLAEKAKKLEKQKAAASGGAVMDRVAELLGLAQQNRDRKGAEDTAHRVAQGAVHSGVTVIVAEVPNAPPDALRGAIDWIRQKTEASAVLLACNGDDGKVTLLAGMSKSVVDRGIKAGDLIKEISPLVGGKGGGRPDLAQGGGTDVTRLAEALTAARTWLCSRLQGA